MESALNLPWQFWLAVGIGGFLMGQLNYKAWTVHQDYLLLFGAVCGYLGSATLCVAVILQWMGM